MLNPGTNVLGKVGTSVFRGFKHVQGGQGEVNPAERLLSERGLRTCVYNALSPLTTGPRYEISVGEDSGRLKESDAVLRKRGKYIAVVADGKVHLRPHKK